MKDLFGDDQFPPHTRSRKGDPWTSHAAAARIAPTLTHKQLRVLSVHRQHPEGLTNFELEKLFGSHGSTWRTRVRELVEFGLVANSGRTRRNADAQDPRAQRVIWQIVQNKGA